ncbi:MAG: class I SAM-dependent methyltransferase [Bacteroidota bacterium]
MAFAKSLNAWRRTGSFLDVGCATGFFINGIRSHSQWNVHGVDFGESAVRFACNNLKLDVRHGDLSGAGFPDGFFDYVHLNNVLEHVLEPVSLLKECRRVIKPDGIFFFSVPNGSNDMLDLINFYKMENKPARSKNGHIFFFPSRTILSLLDQAGFVVVKKKTYSMKRGLRSAGMLPKKSDWKTDYFPKEAVETQATVDINIAQGKKKHSDFYYGYRFIQGNLQMLPGLHRFGLDYLFILRPKQ